MLRVITILFLSFLPTSISFAAEDSGSKASKPKKEEKSTGQKKEGSSEDAAKKKKENEGFTMPPDQLQIPVIHVPVVQKSGLKAYYSITLILRLANKEDVAKVEKVMPYLFSGLYEELYGILAVVWTEDYNPDLASLKKRLLMAAQKSLKYPLGDVTVKDIYVRDFFKHPKA